ncbi:MAG: cation:dicarboxylase symporter family transporter [Anaerotignum sp.]|nr:cation:dicarboxylase symporter family transporter [Anaerotignum sp.]MBQ7085010.1 cation:dicarboxylase symporter family transporter [Anaerotignum sp.]
MMKQIYERQTLSTAVIDDFSEQLFSLLLEQELDIKEALRLRLAAEEALLYWLKELGECPCSMKLESRFGRKQLVLSAEGKRLDPADAKEDPDLAFGTRTMMNMLGVTFSFSYQKGINSITYILPRKKKLGDIQRLLFAILAALVSGFLLKRAPEEVSSFFSEVLLAPLFDTYMGVLSAMAGPMMFLTVLLGIVSIGDTATLSYIGKKLIGMFFAIQFSLIILVSIAGTLFFGLQVNLGGDIKALSLQIITLLLDIIPSNLFQPFIEGNSLQIVFIAGVCGFCVLLLKKQMHFITEFAEDINCLVNYIMKFIGSLAPVFIFICILDMTLSGMLNEILNAKNFMVFFLVLYVLYLVGMLLVFSMKMRLTIGQAFRKLMDCFVLSVTTASSTASFGVAMDTCNRLGIQAKISTFGLPLGIVLFAPVHALGFAAMGEFMLYLSGVEPTLAAMVAMVILSVLLAVAAPPVSGGILACFTILFVQLGIPAEQIALAIALSTIYDYLATAGNMTGIIMLLGILAKDEDLIDEQKLLNDAERAHGVNG